MDYVLEYYRTQGSLTDLGKYTSEAQELSSKPDALSRVVQRLILHDMWIDRYHVRPKAGQWCKAQTPGMEDLLDTLVELNHDKPFEGRPPDERVIACCREFSTMLCSLLRAKGIPARARCGFAAYLAKEGYYEDHWMCEAWNGTSWQRIDPQIDSVQLKAFHDFAMSNKGMSDERRTMLLEFDPQHLKPKEFVLAGEAWLGCRAGEYNPERFGLGINPAKYGLADSYGLWFILGNLVRDYLALNKVEMLPFIEGLEKSKDYWNDWQIMQADYTPSESEYALIDKLAELTLSPDDELASIQKLYTEHPELHPPARKLSRR